MRTICFILFTLPSGAGVVARLVPVGRGRALPGVRNGLSLVSVRGAGAPALVAGALCDLSVQLTDLFPGRGG
jgi:hypothetical protein